MKCDDSCASALCEKRNEHKSGTLRKPCDLSEGVSWCHEEPPARVWQGNSTVTSLFRDLLHDFELASMLSGLLETFDNHRARTISFAGPGAAGAGMGR